MNTTEVEYALVNAARLHMARYSQHRDARRVDAMLEALVDVAETLQVWGAFEQLRDMRLEFSSV